MTLFTTSSGDGTRLALHDLGGTGPLAFLVHGAGLHGRVLSPLAEALGARFRCVAIDLRGHGASAAPAGLDFSWTRLSEDVAAGVAAIGGPAPIGVVHSAGGTAALRAEAVAPGTFSALYCYEPVMRSPAMRDEITAEHPLVAQALRRKTRFSSREEVYERYRSRPPFDVVTEDALRAYIAFGFSEVGGGEVELVCRPEFEAAIYLAGAESDLYELAPRLTCPVTIALGSAPTNTLGPGFARVAAQRLPGARLVTFPGLGHLGPIERPQTVAASIITAVGTAPA